MKPTLLLALNLIYLHITNNQLIHLDYSFYIKKLTGAGSPNTSSDKEKQ